MTHKGKSRTKAIFNKQNNKRVFLYMEIFILLLLSMLKVRATISVFYVGKLLRESLFPYLALISIILFSSSAFAQSQDDDENSINVPPESSTLGETFNAFQTSTVGYMITLLLAILFLGGIVLVIKGLIKLKEASDTNGTQVKYSESLMGIASGTFLVSIVSTLFVGWASLGSSASTWNYGRTVESMPTSSSEDGGFVRMMANFALDAAGPLSTLVLAVSVLIGITLVASSLFGFAKLGSQSGRDGFGALFMKLFIGILLTNVYWVIGIVSNSFGLYNPFLWVGNENFSVLRNLAESSILNYNADEGEGGLFSQAESVMTLAFIGLVPFGLIAFVRGLLIIKDTVESNKQASMGAGMVHLIAGIALVNGKAFSCTVAATFVGDTVTWCS